MDRLDVLNGVVSVQKVIDYAKALIRETAQLNNATLSNCQVDRLLSILLFDIVSYGLENNFDTYYSAIQSPPKEEEAEESDDGEDEEEEEEIEDGYSYVETDRGILV